MLRAHPKEPKFAHGKAHLIKTKLKRESVGDRRVIPKPTLFVLFLTFLEKIAV